MHSAVANRRDDFQLQRTIENMNTILPVNKSIVTHSINIVGGICFESVDATNNLVAVLPFIIKETNIHMLPNIGYCVEYDATQCFTRCLFISFDLCQYFWCTFWLPRVDPETVRSLTQKYECSMLPRFHNTFDKRRIMPFFLPHQTILAHSGSFDEHLHVYLALKGSFYDEIAMFIHKIYISLVWLLTKSKLVISTRETTASEKMNALYFCVTVDTDLSPFLFK